MTDAPCFPGCSTCLLEPGPGEGPDAWKARVRTQLAAEQADRRRSSPYAPTPARIGPPRGDAAVLAVLTEDTWSPLSHVAARLGKPVSATSMALYRAKRRGLLEHKRGVGYRLRKAS
jgi:hypothetical protein